MRIGIGVSVLVLAFVSTTPAEVENFHDCLVHPGYNAANCPLCEKGGAGEEGADCARARATLLSAPTSPWRGNAKALKDMPCDQLKTFAWAHGFKTAKEMREEAKESAERAAAAAVERETDKIKEGHWDAKRNSDALTTRGSPEFWESGADRIEAQANELDKKAYAARRAGNRKLANAYDDAAHESRDQARTAERFAREARTKRDDAQRDQARDIARTKAKALTGSNGATLRELRELTTGKPVKPGPYVDPLSQPLKTDEYGAIDWGLDNVAGFNEKRFVGPGKDGSEGVRASLPLGELDDLGRVDVDNSVALIHDKLLKESGGTYKDLDNPKVVEAHRYAADHFESPLLKAAFQYLVDKAEKRSGASSAAKDDKWDSLLDGDTADGKSGGGRGVPSDSYEELLDE